MAVLGRRRGRRGEIVGPGVRVPARVCVAVLLAAVPGVVPAAYGEARPYSEREVKAAYVLNFAKFVEWPEERLPEEDSPILVGLLCSEPFAEIFTKTIKGKKAQGREVKVMRGRRAKDVEDCHIVFVGASEKAPLPEVLRTFKGRCVLTVGETERFVE